MLKDAGYKVPEINMEAYMKVLPWFKNSWMISWDCISAEEPVDEFLANRTGTSGRYDG